MNKTWNECTREERIERWEQALRVMEAMTPHERENHFDMSDWLNVTDCGTVGCVAGHCGLDPWFHAQGFITDPGWRATEGSWGKIFPELTPTDFFGLEGFSKILVREDFMNLHDEEGNDLAPRRGAEVHAEVCAEIRRYLGCLRARVEYLSE